MCVCVCVTIHILVWLLMALAFHVFAPVWQVTHIPFSLYLSIDIYR